MNSPHSSQNSSYKSYSTGTTHTNPKKKTKLNSVTMQVKNAIVVITTLVMMANIVVSIPETTSLYPRMSTIDQSKEDCNAKCARECVNGGIPNICLMYCVYCCTHSCPPRNQNQSSSPSSYYCNAGCSLHYCAKIKGFFFFYLYKSANIFI